MASSARPPRPWSSTFAAARDLVAYKRMLAAADAAAKANAGVRAVSIYPQMQEGLAVAEVTLLQGTTLKKLTEKLD